MPRSKKRVPQAVILPDKRKTVEGFASEYAATSLRPNDLHLRPSPSQINSIILHRWRVTMELIEEPDEVIGQRLIDLWESNQYNYHHSDAYARLATRYGVTLDPERRGIRCKQES